MILLRDSVHYSRVGFMGKRRALRQFGDVFKRQVVAETYAAGKKKVKIHKDNLVNLTPIAAE